MILEVDAKKMFCLAAAKLVQMVECRTCQPKVHKKKSYQGKTNKAASSSLGQKFTVTNLRSTIVMKLLLDRMVMKVGLIGVALELSRWNSKRHP